MSSPEEMFNEYMYLGKVTIFKMFPDPYGICKQHKIDIADLKQYAYESIWKACLNYNPNKGTNIKTHLINNIRWFIHERLKRETTLIKYDSNKFNTIEKFGLLSMDVEITDDSYDHNTYHDVIASDTNVETDAIGNLGGDYVLSKLNDKQRKVVEMKTKGLNSNEIGKLLNMTGANVRAHFKNSKLKLAKYQLEVN
jgi:RNA polymerase sigma factor (sigma-70 family)